MRIQYISYSLNLRLVTLILKHIAIVFTRYLIFSEFVFYFTFLNCRYGID